MVVYRTSMQIVADLLTVTQLSGQEGIKTTSLLTKANLSHSRLSKFLNNLSAPDQSILEAIKILENNIWEDNTWNHMLIFQVLQNHLD